MGTAAGNTLKDTDLARITTLEKLGVRAWGNRPTASAGTTTEVGVVRLDGIAITAGRMYRIYTGPLALYSNATGDTVAGNIRTSTAGAASTSSPLLGRPLSFNATGTSTSFPESRPLTQVYTATVTGTLSVLLTVSRTQGTGSASIQSGCDLWVEDISSAVGDTGIDI